MNKVIITGNLCRNNDVKVTKDMSSKVLKNTVASKRNYKNKNGEYESDFINFTAFKQAAEFMEMYTSKGDKVLIEGRWETGSYQNEYGSTVYTNELKVERVELLSSKTSKVEQKSVKEQEDNPFNINPDEELPF